MTDTTRLPTPPFPWGGVRSLRRIPDDKYFDSVDQTQISTQHVLLGDTMQRYYTVLAYIPAPASSIIPGDCAFLSGASIFVARV